MLLALGIAAPWHVLATLRNPPYFDFTMHSEKGSYHGFFWFYFINEHVLRFLNLRYPRDYNTVPRAYFWLFHLLWFFPWSLYFPAALRAEVPGCGPGVAGAAVVFVLGGIHPDLLHVFDHAGVLLDAVLSGAGAAVGMRDGERGRVAEVGDASDRGGDGAGTGGDLRDSVDGAGPGGAGGYRVGAEPESGCVHAIAGAHDGFDDGILRVLAGAAGGGGRGVRGGDVGRVAASRGGGGAAALVAMMVLFFHAARMALVVFDPYMSSRPLAEALLAAPPGKLIVDDQYYTFSSVFFYTNRRAYLLNGRVNNLDYGSYAPDAPQDVFIDDAEFQRLWSSEARYYLVVEGPKAERLEQLAGKTRFHVQKFSGGKYLFTNH